ncbi:MAG: hypothetical protein RI932_1249 [Pseudomonadota bacterium]
MGLKSCLPVLLLLLACKMKWSESVPNMLGHTEAVSHELDVPPATVVVGAFAAPSESSTSSRCTGVIVSDDLVLTAAHCVADPDKGLREASLIKVRAQSLGRSGLERDRAVEVSQWKKHPSFTRLGPPDIALLRVKESLEPYGKPVALAPANSLAVLSRLLVAGYGATETNESGGKLLAGWAEVQSMDAQSEFTIRRPQGGASPYYGDSGGPAYLNRQGLWFAAGLVSRGNSSGRVTYTDLSSPEMVSWILKTARELGAQPPVLAGLAGMGTRSVMGATPASTVASPSPESSPASTPASPEPPPVAVTNPPSTPSSPEKPAACGGCRVAELESCIQSGRKDCYPSLGCVDFSQACNASALRICLDNGGGNACYPKWRCARVCAPISR